MKKNKLKETALKFLRKKGVKPLFITLSGAHTYGFPSVDSDYDIRCCHIRPTNDFFHLDKHRDTYEYKTKINGTEVEIVSHEVEKVIKLVLKNNSNILENTFGENLFPTVEHKELVRLAKKAMSKVVYNPYHGMAEFNYKKFISSKNPHYKNLYVKKYLYIIRSYLCGIHALKTGKIEPNLDTLNTRYNPVINRVVNDLIRIKRKGEKLSDDVALLTIEKPAEDLIAKLKAEMEIEKNESKLPERPREDVVKAIDNYLYKIRLRNLK